MRRNPVARDTIVPSAIALLDLARLGEVSSVSRCDPVGGATPRSGSSTLVRLSWASGTVPRSAGTNRGACLGGACGKSNGWKDGCG